MSFQISVGENCFYSQMNAKRGLPYLHQAVEAQNGNVRGRMHMQEKGIALLYLSPLGLNKKPVTR
jgi:hypothetical protein